MEWKPITEYQDIYEISENGDIRRKTGRPLKSSPNSRGYKTIHLSKDGVERAFSVHVLVAEAFIGQRPNFKHVNHIDGVKTNNHFSNLEYVTQAENMQHAHRSGLMRLPKGERQWKSKLTAEQVEEIRKLCASGESQRVIGLKYGVGQQAISDIKCGKNWKSR